MTEDTRRTARELLALCLSLCAGWGRVRINRVMSRPHLDAERAWSILREGAIREAAGIFATDALALPLDSLAELAAKAQHHHDSIRARGLRMLLPEDKAYPAAWRESLDSDMPPFALALGNTDLANARWRGGIVGTRAPSGDGVRFATRCAETLVALDCAVVSGGAAGIDAAAHNAALESGGNTIFIVPADILGYCPAWIEAAISGRALFLSESLPGALWTTHAAVQRNRLIAAMAQAVWVVEPRKEGGSIRTARIAAGLNRPVACYRPPDTFKNVIPWLVFSGPDALSKDTIRGMLEHAGPTQGDLFKPPPT